MPEKCPTCNGTGEVWAICAICGKRYSPWEFDFVEHSEKVYQQLVSPEVSDAVE